MHALAGETTAPFHHLPETNTPSITEFRAVALPLKPGHHTVSDPAGCTVQADRSAFDSGDLQPGATATGCRYKARGRGVESHVRPAAVGLLVTRLLGRGGCGGGGVVRVWG